MTKLYLIRHCQTIGNLKDIFQGASDFDPSEKGYKQLELLKGRFKDIHLDGIYSSPLGRAYKTAEAVRGERDMPITVVDGLKEMHVGIHENTNFKEYIKHDPELYDIWHNKQHLFAPKGGETTTQVYERMWNAVKSIIEQNEGKTVAVTSHGFAIKCLLTRLYYNDITRISEVEIPANTAVSLFEFDGADKFEIKYFNDDSHVSDEYKTTFVIKR